jgi:hypothetical protein
MSYFRSPENGASRDVGKLNFLAPFQGWTIVGLITQGSASLTLG